MDVLSLALGLLLPWVVGTVTLLAAPRRVHPLALPGELAWLAGAGYFVGAFVLTVWMRVGTAVGIDFGRGTIGAPLLLASVALGYHAWRRNGPAIGAAVRSALRTVGGVAIASPAARLAWRALLVWIVVRFALLALELAWRPLYPWNAWTQWATKARVWFAYGHIVPFADASTWFADAGNVYFDASPGNPPMLPLLQVWACVALGHWDDTLMNWPWWQFAVALALAVYGALRSLGVSDLGALVGSFLASSIPLANVHVALAGYADLPLAAYYTMAVLALLRWCETRSTRELGLAALLALACTQVSPPGGALALTLAAGAIVVMFPRHGLRAVAVAIGLAVLALVALARIQPQWSGIALDFESAARWQQLAQGAFLLGSWHLLWYAVPVVALLAWRELVAAPLAPLTAIVATAMLLTFALLAFPILRVSFAGQATPNRALLHLAPLVVVYLVLAYRDCARRMMSMRTGPAAEPPAATDAGLR